MKESDSRVWDEVYKVPLSPPWSFWTQGRGLTGSPQSTHRGGPFLHTPPPHPRRTAGVVRHVEQEVEDQLGDVTVHQRDLGPRPPFPQ